MSGTGRRWTRPIEPKHRRAVLVAVKDANRASALDVAARSGLHIEQVKSILKGLVNDQLLTKTSIRSYEITTAGRAELETGNDVTHSLHFSDVNIHFNGDLSGEIVITEAVDKPGDHYERALTSLAEIANAALRSAGLTLTSEQGKQVVVSAATVRDAVGQWALDKEAEEFEVLEPADIFSDDHRCARVREWAADSNRKRRIIEVIREGIDNYYTVNPEAIAADPLVGVVFGTTDSDGGQGYYLYEAGTVVFADGSFDGADFGTSLRTLFDDEYGRVNEPFTIAVDLRTGTFDESDDKFDVSLCQRFGIPDPDVHRAAVAQRLRDKRRTRSDIR